jgi:RNA polymerase sigma-70 factor (ECF subfamily)
MPLDDTELVDRIRTGSTDEYAELVQRHQDQVFAILYRYERDHQKLEDLAQETFLKAWRSLHQFDSRAPFAHWLSRIAVRVALDHLRKERRRRNEVGFPELGEDTLEWLRTPEQRNPIEAHQAAELLALAMHELTPQEQIVITMLELEGHTVKEICQCTGSSNVAVRVRAVRARAKLRRALERLTEERGK